MSVTRTIARSPVCCRGLFISVVVHCVAVGVGLVPGQLRAGPASPRISDLPSAPDPRVSRFGIGPPLPAMSGGAGSSPVMAHAAPQQPSQQLRRTGSTRWGSGRAGRSC
eukprot:8279691-Alexandrium_andersonii.AAC.1